MSVTGTFNGTPIIAVPTAPGFQSIEFNMIDSVAANVSPFTGQTQVMQWPGADLWTGVATLPPLSQNQADLWSSFLMELRGMAYTFQLGDPLKKIPSGTVNSTSAPYTQNTNLAMSQVINTLGWKINTYNLLSIGDYIQVGYRLHRVLQTVSSNSDGYAQISIWPSLRESTVNGTKVTVSNCKGLFRLSQNKRTWSAGQSRTTRISIPFMEAR